MPYDIRSSVVDTKVMVEWSTRRNYISTVKLQKADDNSPGHANPWRSCHDVAADVEVRYRRLGDNDTMLVTEKGEEPFTTKTAITFTTPGATFSTHTARFELPSAMQNAAYEFTVGSVFHGWSAIHRLGVTILPHGDESERCRPRHVHTAYGLKSGSLAVQWMTKEFCGGGDAQLLLKEGYFAHIEVDGPNRTSVMATANTTLFEDDGEEKSKRWIHVVRLEGLKPATRYTYVVGNAHYNSWSIPFSTKTAPAPLFSGEKPIKSTRFLITGDISYQNAATLPMMQSEVAEGIVDGLVCLKETMPMICIW
ncbi:unnamed protein product [Peronospora belbahrii]|uniref:Purple acid phosphatase N-terminal domain-containing protein n=1 Tax=Peronospora belbahrii TaxID=622444 RepID=A0AAU9KME8_9STRA|nr:unnamed protein product [Peronospora belbahrii]